MKKSLLVVTLALAALSLTACGGAADTKAPAAASAAPASNASAPADSKAGATAMRKELAELKGALEAKDAAKAQMYAEETDEAWESFEDGVKAKDKALYEKIEDPLHAITAGVKVSPLDTKVLLEQVAKLDALLAELAK